MRLTAITVPFVLPREFLRSIELTEAVGDGDAVRQIRRHILLLASQGLLHFENLLHVQLLQECLLMVLGPVQKLVHAPALTLVELNDYLKVQLVSLSDALRLSVLIGRPLARRGLRARLHRHA